MAQVVEYLPGVQTPVPPRKQSRVGNKASDRVLAFYAQGFGLHPTLQEKKKSLKVVAGLTLLQSCLASLTLG
jgi:hypothetical protein